MSVWFGQLRRSYVQTSQSQVKEAKITQTLWKVSRKYDKVAAESAVPTLTFQLSCPHCAFIQKFLLPICVQQLLNGRHDCEQQQQQHFTLWPAKRTFLCLIQIHCVTKLLCCTSAALMALMEGDAAGAEGQHRLFVRLGEVLSVWVDQYLDREQSKVKLVSRMWKRGRREGGGGRGSEHAEWTSFHSACEQVLNKGKRKMKHEV